MSDPVRPVPSDTPLPDSYLAFDARPFRLRMGLKPLEPETWIELDDRFEVEMALKAQLHRDHHDDVVVALPGSEDACAEVLDALLVWLEARYPGRLAARRAALGRAAASAGAVHPIETAGLLVQEDLCVLVPDGKGGLPFVAGSVSFPSRWRLRDKIGLPMAAVHGPVAHYAEQLANPVDAGLARLTPERGVWRVNWNLFDDPALFQLGGHSRPGVNETITPDNAGDTMWLRVERQTFRRFPGHQSVLFTIRTFQRPLSMVAARRDLAARLAAALRGMPPETAAYKSVNVWRDAVLAYLDARC
jgi:hypothetical protein